MAKPFSWLFEDLKRMKTLGGGKSTFEPSAIGLDKIQTAPCGTALHTMLGVRYISGNNFSITERGILEEWEIAVIKIERIKALIEK